MKKLFKNKVAMFALAALAVIVTFIFLSNPVTGCALAFVFPLIVKVGSKDFTVKSQDEKDQMDQLINLMNAITEKAISGFITADEAAQKISDKIAEKGFKLEDDAKFKEYAAAVVKQGLEIKSLTEKGNSLQGKSIEEQLRQQITEKKTDWEDFIGKKSQKFSFQLNLKVAGSMLPSTNAGAGTIPYQFIPGVNEIMAGRVKPFLIDLIGVQGTVSPTIYWTNKTNADGTTAFIYDSGTLAEIDFDLTAESSTAKNVGDYIKVHENMLNDIPYISSEIQNELLYQVNHLCDHEVWKGVGTTVHLKGIQVFASAGFSLTSLAYITPNIYDVILACKTQILNSSDRFDPNTVLLNPVDYAKMIGAKSSIGTYVIPPYASANGDVAGMRIVESNLVDAGDIAVFDSRLCKLFELGNMTVEAGFEGSDFKDMTRTFRAYRRLHFFISDNNTTGFVYDAIADVMAAITTI